MQEELPGVVATSHHHVSRAYTALVVTCEEPLCHLSLPVQLNPLQFLLVLSDFIKLLILEVLFVLLSLLPLEPLLLLLLMALST